MAGCISGARRSSILRRLMSPGGRLLHLPEPARASRPLPGRARTCTLRTRFASYEDVARAVALLVQEDGRLFVPIVAQDARLGEPLRVLFVTLDGGASVIRRAVVDSTAPDWTVSQGRPGLVLRLLAGEPAGPSGAVEPE